MAEDAGGLRKRGAATQPPWQGPILAGLPAAAQPPAAATDSSESDSEGGGEDEDEGDGTFPTPPPNPEDDLVIRAAVASFFAAVLLAAALPADGKQVGLAGLASLLLGAALLIFVHHARAVSAALGVGIACGSLGLIFGGILQDVVRYALLDLSGLRAALARA